MVHFVLVHGAGAGGWHWYKVVDLLWSSGHQVSAIDLGASGSNRKDHSDILTFDDYCEPLFQLLTELPEDEKVVLVAHSLGGSSVAYATELYPHKVGLGVYMASKTCSKFLMKHKQDPSKFEYFYGRGKDYPPTAALSRKSGSRLHDENCNCHRQCSSEDRALTELLERPIPIAALTPDFENTQEKYGSVPVVYVKTLQDLALPATVQDHFVETHPFGNLKGTFSIDSHHCAAMIFPEQVHQLLVSAANQYFKA